MLSEKQTVIKMCALTLCGNRLNHITLDIHHELEFVLPNDITCYLNQYFLKAGITKNEDVPILDYQSLSTA